MHKAKKATSRSGDTSKTKQTPNLITATKEVHVTVLSAAMMSKVIKVVGAAALRETPDKKKAAIILICRTRGKAIRETVIEALKGAVEILEEISDNGTNLIGLMTTMMIALG